MSMFLTPENTIKPTKTLLSSPIYQWTVSYGACPMNSGNKYAYYGSALAAILDAIPRYACS